MKRVYLHTDKIANVKTGYSNLTKCFNAIHSTGLTYRMIHHSIQKTGRWESIHESVEQIEIH